MDEDGLLLNYMIENKVHLVTDIVPYTCHLLISQLSVYVNKMKMRPVYDGHLDAQLKTPYELPTHLLKRRPYVLDVYISATRGKPETAQNILSWLNLARHKGAIIRTTILGNTADVASMIAVQGTKEFRIIHENALNDIWSKPLTKNGKDSVGFVTPDAANEMDLNDFRYYETWCATYATHSELMKLKTPHIPGNFNAYECVGLGICDWVLNNDGTVTRHNPTLRRRARSAIYAAFRAAKDNQM